PGPRRGLRVGSDGFEKGQMGFLRQPRRDPPPEHPPGRPDRGLLVVGQALRKERPRLLAPPGVERRAEPGPEQESAEREKHALMVRAPPPLLRSRPEHAPEIAVGRQRPGGAIAEHALEIAPDVLRARVVHGLLAEYDLELLAGRIDVARELRDAAGFPRFAPELELQLPALRAFAEHLERADLGEHSL